MKLVNKNFQSLNYAFPIDKKLAGRMRNPRLIQDVLTYGSTQVHIQMKNDTTQTIHESLHNYGLSRK